MVVPGDVDYARHGVVYTSHRRTDPRIAAVVHAGLGTARTVLNVGAGAGSYEPTDRYVLAVEPSAAMRAKRPPGLAPALNAVAESLPFDDHAFDASMAMVTIHQWPDSLAGIAEMRRVTKGPVVLLTFDGEVLDRLWLMAYAPELHAAERRRYPAIEEVATALGSDASVQVVPVPIDCVDGFTEAFYARPEMFLESDVRRSQSAWTFLEPGVEERIVATLAADLASGEWDRSYGALRTQPEFMGALRLIVSG